MYKEVVETKAQFDWREERYPTNRRITIDIVSEVVAEEDIVRLQDSVSVRWNIQSARSILG